ncbi:MAG TPA: hypothetical protein VJQ59_15565, partial [Candidatus Sulfotelmatobacter sp.]|nr:hypothetical protein [Candidatus Sulfotelmatobacter sp.]
PPDSQLARSESRDVSFGAAWKRATTAQKTILVSFSVGTVGSISLFALGQFFQVRDVKSVLASRVFLYLAAGLPCAVAWQFACLMKASRWKAAAAVVTMLLVGAALSLDIAYPMPAHIHPDIDLALIYPQEFAAIFLNRSSVTLNEPSWRFMMWDLDAHDINGYPTNLKIPSGGGPGAWIAQHSMLPPEAIIYNVRAQVKPGDRLFGWASVTCPDCIKSRTYWIYAIEGSDGWFAESTVGEPDISYFTSANVQAIGEHLDEFWKREGVTNRKSIYTHATEVR